jgi:hypothetical protein
LKPNFAIIEEQFGSRMHRFKDLGVGQWRTAFVASLALEVDAKMLAGNELDPTFREGSEPQLWSLQIGQDADWPASGAFNVAYGFETGSMILVDPVAEV